MPELPTQSQNSGISDIASTDRSFRLSRQSRGLMTSIDNPMNRAGAFQGRRRQTGRLPQRKNSEYTVTQLEQITSGGFGYRIHTKEPSNTAENNYFDIQEHNDATYPYMCDEKQIASFNNNRETECRVASIHRIQNASTNSVRMKLKDRGNNIVIVLLDVSELVGEQVVSRSVDTFVSELRSRLTPPLQQDLERAQTSNSNTGGSSEFPLRVRMHL